MPAYTFPRATRLIGLERLPIEVINRGESSFKNDLQEIYEGIQGDRTAMLAQVRELQLATQVLLAAEAARIAGFAPDDDRIAELTASAQMIADRVGMLDREVEVATIRVPMVKATEALLHGRITDEASRPVGPVTVTLADERGTSIAGVPPVEVDSAGYYAIVVPDSVAAEVGSDRKLSLVVSHGSARVPANVTPLTLSAGTVAAQDVQLAEVALDTLKLRLPVQLDSGAGRIVAPRKATPRSAGTAAERGASKPAARKRRGA